MKITIIIAQQQQLEDNKNAMYDDVLNNENCVAIIMSRSM